MSRHTPTYRARRQRMRRQRKYKALIARLDAFGRLVRERRQAEFDAIAGMFAVHAEKALGCEPGQRVVLEAYTHADRQLFDALQATPGARRGTLVLPVAGDLS